MHVTPYQATLSPSTGAPITGAQLTGAVPFTFSTDGIANSAGDRRATLPPAADSLETAGDSGSDDLKEAFQDFVGQTFFGEMIKSFRTTQQPSKYFNGGRAEEIFQGQFDQVLTEKLSDASSEKIADPMYELFMLKRSS